MTTPIIVSTFSKTFKNASLIRSRYFCMVYGPERLPKNRARHGLVGIGQPVLDFTVPLTIERAEKLLQTCNKLRGLKGNEFLNKTCEYSKNLFEEFIEEGDNKIELSNDTPIILPGGCTLNAVRVAQWLLEEDAATTFIGCIGDDVEGERMHDLMKLCGVNPVLRTIKMERTAKCLHISTDDSIMNSIDPGHKNHKFHKSMETYQLFYFPGAASHISLSTLKQPEPRFAIAASSYVLASLNLANKPPNFDQKPANDLFGPDLLIRLSEFVSSEKRIFCLRLPSSSTNKSNATDSTVPVNALSASQWIDLLSNVDILFTDLGSALDVAQTLADWSDSIDSQQHKSQRQVVSRPEIRRRFAEFAASVLLSEKRTPGLSASGSPGAAAYASNLYEPIAHSLAATMPGLAERLGFCLANLPKRNGERARTVVILGAGSAAGGMVACTSNGELYRLSDFVLAGFSNTLGEAPTSYLTKIMGLGQASSHQEFLFHGDGTGKCADGFVGGVLAKLMSGSSIPGNKNSLSEALLVGSRVAHLLSLDRACSFPKKLPTDLKLAMSQQSNFL